MTEQDLQQLVEKYAEEAESFELLTKEEQNEFMQEVREVLIKVSTYLGETSLK